MSASKQKYCKAGHPLVPSNTYSDGKGGLTCKRCKRIGSKKGYVEYVNLQMYLWNTKTQRDRQRAN